MTQSERDSIVADFMPQVTFLAKRMHHRVPSYISYEDMIQDGVVGLLKAMSKYQPSRGNDLKTFAEPRIKGEIRDGLRRIDWAPRSLRRFARRLARSANRLSNGTDRQPSEEELACDMKISISSLRKLRHDLQAVELVSLHGTECGIAFKSNPLRSKEKDPLEISIEHELARRLQNGIARLPWRDRLLVELYYYRQMNMKEVGRQLGIGEARISQVHAKIIGRLRGTMQGVQ